ncbi:unnamed protein product [Rotaria magnacalcarata]|uniref:Uncharacterized protein n=1 Tax=Rotaria magnacalcarata TaxID=392030 RepID=A0A816L1K5_9BILA|nr:unnamed protein product [Rotaria magnacalcarata]
MKPNTTQFKIVEKYQFMTYKKSLGNSKVNLYRRCGKDRNDKEDHNLCEIKCHHCDGPHTSTDYSCSFIQQYRREPVLELRNHPDLFPAEAAIIHTN